MDMPRKASTRAAHGAGSLRQRKDNSWEGRFTYTDPLGRTQRGSVYAPTQAACRKKLAAAIREVDQTGTFIKRQRYTLDQWSREWLETYCVDLKPRSRDDYERRMNQYIRPALGTVQLSALNNIMIQRFLNGLRGQHGQALSPKTTKNTHSVLHSCLRQAVLAGVIPSNPADNIRLPSVTKADLRPLMDEDLTKFMKACQTHPLGNLFIVDLFTGLRQSELLGLQWRDIDFDSGTIHVSRQLQRDRNTNEFIFLTTKNGKDRYVPFSSSIGTILKEIRRNQSVNQLAAGELWQNRDGLVFTNQMGGHLTHSHVQNSFRKLVRSLGLDGTRFHDLRHSAATLALQSGCSIKSVQDMLGHYSAAFTLDVYSDVSRKMQIDTQNRLEEAFKAASAG